MKITADEIIAMNPCASWPHDVIRKRIGKGKTPTQIAKSEDVPITDRHWLLTNYAARNNRIHLVLWAAGCAQDVRDRIHGEDSRDDADCAIQTAVAWAEGCATEQDCRDAYVAAASASVSVSVSVSAAAAAAASAAYAAAYAVSVSAAAAAAAAYAADYADYASALLALAEMLEAT